MRYLMFNMVVLAGLAYMVWDGNGVSSFLPSQDNTPESVPQQMAEITPEPQAPITQEIKEIQKIIEDEIEEKVVETQEVDEVEMVEIAQIDDKIDDGAIIIKPEAEEVNPVQNVQETQEVQEIEIEAEPQFMTTKQRLQALDALVADMESVYLSTQ